MPKTAAQPPPTRVAPAQATDPEPVTPVNEVTLVGRLSGVEDDRVLPSGDIVRTIRVVVARPPRSGASKSTVTVDTIDVACWSAATRRAVAKLAIGDEVRVEGALRRRFFRAGGAPASRYEVEAGAIRRVRRARA